MADVRRGVDGGGFGLRGAWVGTLMVSVVLAGCGEAAPVVTESPATTVAPVTAASATTAPTPTAAPTAEPAPAPAAPPTTPTPAPAPATAVPAPATTAPPDAAAGLAAWLQAIDQSPEATGFAARPPDAYRGAVAIGDRDALAPAAEEALSVQELLALIDAVGPPPEEGADLVAAWADGLVAVADGLDALATCADEAACQQAFAGYETAYATWQEAAAALPVAIG